MYKYLDNISSPSDFRDFSPEQLAELCAEVRDYMVRCCAVNPGHLASSLGAVEIITAVHSVYDTPRDKFVFDVGHQAYAHKILTGRRDAFKGNRTRAGISGFPNRSESTYDAFGVGHSSTSISAALGMAEAARLSGSGEKVVALIGDGALTGGLAFEGLNNAGACKSDLLVILNDNNQSIDGNIGAMHDYLLNITTNPAYNRLKDKVWHRMGAGKLRSGVQRFVMNAKTALVRKTGGDLFEALGFRYFGPINGNDIKEVTEALRRLKDIKGPRVLHCLTTKGKGFGPAEQDPVVWHAPGKFDAQTGQRLTVQRKADRYQDVFGEVLLDLARKDSRVVGITPAMATGCGMNRLAAEMPSRFYDVGIEEEHAVTFSAGLAASGMKPFCNIYSSFSQRAYDQIIHDVALQKLPVVLCLDRAGLVGEDGATHHGCFDMAAYRSIPDTTIIAPRNEAELKNAMYTGLGMKEGPYIIRYPRGGGEGTGWKDTPYTTLTLGKGERLRDGKDIAVLALGPVANRAVEAAEAIGQECGTEVAVYDMRYLKPIDTAILEEAAACGKIVTVEDGSLKGGLYSEVCEYMAGAGHQVTIKCIGIPDRFISQAGQGEERAECGLDANGIEEILRFLK